MKSAANENPHRQSAFLSILPKVLDHARCSFRYVRCPHACDDAVAETVALCWKWFGQLVDQGKDPARFPTVLASYATRAVRAGRRLCKQESGKDALSPSAQRRHGFVVTKLPDRSTLSENPLSEALIDNTQSPVPDQVHFRLDFPFWLNELDDRNRQITVDMAFGHHTGELAGHYRVSPSRISQLRRELEKSWESFIGEIPRDSQYPPQRAA